MTSAAGAATEALLSDVRTAAISIAAPYDNLLIKSAEVITQGISVTIILPQALSDEGISDKAEQIIRNLFKISSNRLLNELYISDIVVALKTEIPTAKSIKVTLPANDVLLTKDKVIVVGAVSVTIERV